MRLTIHHTSQLAPTWQDSLNRLLATDSLTPAQLLEQGQWHLAIFNDRVVGLAVSQGEKLVYLAVRDVTRRRGVGHYLLGETLAWLKAHNIGMARLDLTSARPEEQTGLKAFLRAQGFAEDGQHLYHPL